ncbi:tetratricopeptide repeat protein [Spirochaetota bacterium]
MKLVKTKKVLIIVISILFLFTLNSGLMAGYYNRGRTYFTFKKYDKAKEMFLRAVEKSEHGDSYYFLGEIEKLQGNFKEAEEFFNKAVDSKYMTKKYRKNAFWNLIVLADQKGNYNEVVKTCKKMWNKLRDYSAKQKIESLINKFLWTENKAAIKKYKQGLKLKERKKYDKALELFKEAANLDAFFLAPKFELGMHAYRNNEIDTASSYLSEIASKIPFYAEVHLIMGEINFNKGYYRNTIEYLTNSLEYGFISRKTEYMIKVKRGTSYYKEGDYDKAEEDILDAISLRGKSFKLLILISAINIKQKQYESALKHLKMANRIKGNHTSVLYQIGSIYYKKNDSRFVRYFDNLFNITKNKDPGKYIKAFRILMNEHYKRGNYRKALSIISQLPENYRGTDVQLLEAKIYYKLNRIKKSIELFEKLYLNDDDKLILSMAYSRSGRKDRAKEILINLIYYDKYKKLASKNRYLKRIVREIEKEKKKDE